MLHPILASFWLPVQASRNAPEYDYLFDFIMGITIFFSTLIMAMLVYFVFKFRHKEGKQHDPTGGHSTALELTWTIIPTLLVLVIFYYGFLGYLHANTIPPYADHVTANGQMWAWSFTYPSTGHTDPELHLVVNRPTEMILSSADVLHDLAIPAFRMKKDAVPGRYNKEWFEPNLPTERPKAVVTWQVGQAIPPLETSDDYGDYGLYFGVKEFPEITTDLLTGETCGFEQVDGKPAAVYTHNGQKKTVPLDPTKGPQFTWKKIGFYEITCDMYCGTGHSIMYAKCIVETQAEFDRWMANQIVWEPRMSYVARGKDLYASMGCSACHSIDGSKLTGPSWKDLYGDPAVPIAGGPSVLADDAYITESIVYPAAKIVQGFENKMPGDYGTKLKPNDITALIWYMKSISKHYTGSMAEGTTVGAAVKAAAPTTMPSAK